MLPEETQVEDSIISAADASTRSLLFFGIGCPFFWFEHLPPKMSVHVPACMCIFISMYVCVFMYVHVYISENRLDFLEVGLRTVLEPAVYRYYITCHLADAFKCHVCT